MRIASRCAVIALITVATAFTMQAADSYDSIIARIDSLATDPVEGIWRINADGAILAVSATAGEHNKFDLTVFESSDLSVPEGCRVGYLTAGARRGRYDAHILASPGTTSNTQRHIVIDLGDHDSRMTFTAYRRGTRISLWRWIPYLFRVTVSRRDDTPADLEGAVRIYPHEFSPLHIIL